MSSPFDTSNAGAFGDAMHESRLGERDAGNELEGYVVGGNYKWHVQRGKLLRTKTVDAYSLATDTWRVRQPVPYSLEDNSEIQPGAAAGGLGYIGARIDETAVGRTLQYNGVFDTWRPTAKFPNDLTLLEQGQATRITDRLYFFDVRPIRGPELYACQYNTTFHSWTRETSRLRPPPPYGWFEQKHLACTIGDKCYHYKSEESFEYRSFSETYEYYPAGKAWTKKKRAMWGVMGAAGKTLDGEAYAHGGISQRWVPPAPPVWIVTRMAESYLPSTDSWRVRATWLVDGRWLHRAFVLPDDGPSIIVTGGDKGLWSKHKILNETARFNAKEDTWTTLSDMPIKRKEHESWAI